MTDAAALISIEHVLWEPDEAWVTAVQELADRFRRAHPLDADAIHALPTLVTQLDALDAWAEASGANLDRELGRWFDEHLSMHLRPQPTRTRAIRALAADRPVYAVSALPPRVAEAIARHAGAWRSFSDLHANVRSPQALDAVAAERAATLIVRTENDLSATTS